MPPNAPGVSLFRENVASAQSATPRRRALRRRDVPAAGFAPTPPRGTPGPWRLPHLGATPGGAGTGGYSLRGMAAGGGGAPGQRRPSCGRGRGARRRGLPGCGGAGRAWPGWRRGSAHCALGEGQALGDLAVGQAVPQKPQPVRLLRCRGVVRGGGPGAGAAGTPLARRRRGTLRTTLGCNGDSPWLAARPTPPGKRIWARRRAGVDEGGGCGGGGAPRRGEGQPPGQRGRRPRALRRGAGSGPRPPASG